MADGVKGLLDDVERTADSFGADAQDVGVDHGRGYVAVPEELLDGADVLTALQ